MHKLALVAIVAATGVASAAPKVKPAPKSKLTISIGEPTVAGALEPGVVAKALERKKAPLVACFKKHHARLPDGAGSATVLFTVGGNGAVTSATTDMLIVPLDACVNTTLTKLAVGKPTDGATVEVMFDVRYDPGDDAVFGGPLGTANGEGTGLGTIGTGRFGIGGGMGVGPGKGHGIGGLNRRSSAVPTITIGRPTVKGDLDAAILRRYLRRNIMKLQYCYEKELLATPGIQGTVTVAFTIGSDGRVSASSADGLRNTSVQSCMANVIKAIEFPKPKSSEVVVSYPITVYPGAKPAATKPSPAEKAP